MNDKIKNYFYDVNTGFVSANKLYKKMIEDGYDVSRKQIKQFYDNQEVVQKTKTHPLKTDRVYNSIIASQYGSNYQISFMIGLNIINTSTFYALSMCIHVMHHVGL